MALITGGTSGIGRDAALRFAAEGAQVIFTGRSRERGQSTLDEIKANEQVIEAYLGTGLKNKQKEEA